MTASLCIHDSSKISFRISLAICTKIFFLPVSSRLCKALCSYWELKIHRSELSLLKGANTSVERISIAYANEQEMMSQQRTMIDIIGIHHLYLPTHYTPGFENPKTSPLSAMKSQGGTDDRRHKR